LFERAIRLIQRNADLAPQLVAGFYDMTGVQLRFVEALRHAGRLAAMWVPIQEGEPYRFARTLVDRFRELQLVHDPMLHIGAPQVTVSEGDSKHDELRGVCAEIAALLDTGTHPRQVGIVARSLDPHDAHLLTRFAAEHGFTTTYAGSTPLVAQRIGRGIITLLRLRERGFPRAEVLELVRDGLRTKVRIDPDQTDLEARRARIAGGTSEELRAVRRKNRTLDDYVALVGELESLVAEPRTGREWSELLTRFASMFRVETSIDVAALDAIDEVAALFRRAQAMNARFDASSIIDALEQRSVDGAAGDSHGVWLGDVMKLRGRTFEHLFVIRMQDDLFPQRRVEDPLLPDSDRRLAGVREIGNGRDEEQLLFQLLFDATTTALRFSYSGSDGFGRVLRRSQYLRGLLDAGAELRRRRGAENPRSRAAVPPQPGTRNPQRALQLLSRAGTSGPFDGYIGPRERFARVLQSVTPTQLEDFGECPQKFLLKWILDVRDIDDPEREVQINHRDKGTIDHRILERFYRTLTPEEIEEARETLPRLPLEIGERLARIIDDEFDKLEADQPAFNRAIRGIERRATKRNLRDFVALDLADLLATGLAPKHFEYRFGPKYRERADHAEAFMIATGGGEAERLPIRVEGSIDRIDVGGGKYRIVDYKSGKALRHQELGKKIDRGVRLQLALYAMAVSEFFSLDAASIDGTIKPLVAGPKTKFDFNLGQKRAALVETLDIFVGAIANGTFPAFPNDGEKPEDFKSCKYCPVNHSCRTKHDAEEKYAVTRARDPRTLLSTGPTSIRASDVTRDDDAPSRLRALAPVSEP
ncbi:MAG: nuclease family protein, partial [Acidobacteria bacterium]|nr:nuclease family protein [Acidobacteriota bacterium]